MFIRLATEVPSKDANRLSERLTQRFIQRVVL